MQRQAQSKLLHELETTSQKLSAAGSRRLSSRRRRRSGRGGKGAGGAVQQDPCGAEEVCFRTLIPAGGQAAEHQAASPWLYYKDWGKLTDMFFSRIKELTDLLKTKKCLEAGVLAVHFQAWNGD